MQALAKWPVSSQKKQLLGRRPWLLGERALVALVDLEPWEVANLAIRYASVTVCATSLFQSSCKSLSVLDLATYTMEEGVDRPVACLSYITRREIQNREAVQEFWNNESVQTVTDGYSRSTFAASHGSRSTVEALAIRTRSPSSQGLR